MKKLDRINVLVPSSLLTSFKKVVNSLDLDVSTVTRLLVEDFYNSPFPVESTYDQSCGDVLMVCLTQPLGSKLRLIAARQKLSVSHLIRALVSAFVKASEEYGVLYEPASISYRHPNSQNE